MLAIPPNICYKNNRTTCGHRQKGRVVRIVFWLVAGTGDIASP